MLHFIRTNRLSKIIACYLAIQIIIQFTQPISLYALTSGPSQPEFNSFTPIGTSNMVNLSSGDFNYNIPIMDVGGYPINLSYQSGIKMDQEASWVGLGWNLNIGQITRQMRGVPDDFKGDMITYENNLKDNVSVGVNGDVRAAVFGLDAISLGIGVGVQYNNYNGITFNTSFGPSFDLSERVSVGMRFGSTSAGGVSVSPAVSLSEEKDKSQDAFAKDISGNFGISYDSRQGLTNLNIGANNSDLFKTQSSLGANLGIQFNDYLTYTPTNNLSFKNTNLTLSLAVGGEVFGVEGQGQITAWASIQKLAEKIELKPAYGYENTENNIEGKGILDFNREKDRTISENTKTLASVNYTYDKYIVSGQGIQGSFRPYRSQVGNIYDATSSSSGEGGSLGAEIGAPVYAHIGLDIEANPSTSISGRWQGSDNTVLSKLSLDKTNAPNFERTYYKTSGDISADKEYSESGNQFFGNKPLKIGLGGGKFKRKTVGNYKVKSYNGNNLPIYTTAGLNKIKRPKREDRKQSILKITNEEAGSIGLVKQRADKFVKAHHTAGYIIFQPDGTRYVYGETAYNTRKEETTFATNKSANCATGLVSYNPNPDNTIHNSSGRDNYFNNIITPAYVHTYLLTAVLSDDYEDLTNNGPTPDDLGNYTKINYSKINNYKWRVPVQKDSASYHAGLNTDNLDEKGSYIYGEKELKYVREIATKTHIAIFDPGDRLDAKEVMGKNGGMGTMSSKKLDAIRLYSLPDYIENGTAATPIKTVHFDYTYELCEGTPNSKATNKGKLTLNKLYFTYADSFMGEYTPYQFHYSGHNPSYNLKGYDVWGNYKENQGISSCNVTAGALTSTEFPFVKQNKSIADKNATAWSLESIDLPSGGKLTIEQESDDYRYVQDRKAMLMFKLVGAGNTATPSTSQLTNNRLYNGSNPMRFLYVKLPDNLPEGYDPSDFIQDLIHNAEGSNGDIGTENNMMYFRILTNMTRNGSQDYDYVTGYVSLDRDTSAGDVTHFDINGNHYLSLPLQFQEKEGGLINSGEQVNPIAKAGWYFARKHLNRQAYGLSDSGNLVDEGNLESMAIGLLKSLANVTEILGGPNQALKRKNIASKFIPEKSWVRLYEPFGNKYGGGSRVKKIILEDNWDAMVDEVGNGVYQNTYGKEYFYSDQNKKSTGVATFEPNGSKENPFVLPIYDEAVKLIAPKEYNYAEKPIGESFYPAAQVTYSEVRVKNIEKNINEKLTTGETITEFYTSKDFPVISDFTTPSVEFDQSGILGNFLKVKTKNHLTMSQGFVVRTNNMNGKMKKQRIRGADQEAGQFISGVDYIYSLDENGKLNNEVNVIHSNGTANPSPVGVTYDMINDFRKSKSSAEVYGADGNLGIIPALFGIPLPIPSVFPNYKYHEDIMKTVTTTKVVHTQGILKKKIVYDLGSSVITENIGWNAQTGNVLLTKTNNEYGDAYYNFTYPANWYYDKMGLASENIGFKGVLDSQGNGFFRVKHPVTESLINASNYLNLGDVLHIEESNNRYWVVYINGYDIRLMNREGNLVGVDNGRFKIIRSGNRNLLNASMASVTSRKNPFSINGDGNLVQLRSPAQWKVINASAVEYSSLWNGVCDPNFPFIGSLDYNSQVNINAVSPGSLYNPYLLNEKGDYRAEKSYAYLTGRNNGAVGFHPRKEGFFNDFQPFYMQTSSGGWQIDDTNWTFASEVTKITSYGAEVENKDALGRYSAAIYDYYSSLPIGVASNSQYKEVGVDNFEYSDGNQVHFSFKDAIEEQPQAIVFKNDAHTGKNSVKINAGSSLTYTLIPECPSDVLPCDASVTANESIGIYIMEINIGTGTGEYGICYDARGIPDRFQIYYEDSLVADSKYVGGALSTYASNYINNSPYVLNEYEYTSNSGGTAVFTSSGTTASIEIKQCDIANGSPEEPTAGAGMLVFQKNSPTPIMTVVVTGPNSGTAWDICNIICEEDDVIPMAKIIYIDGFKGGEQSEDFIPFDENIHEKAVIIKK